MMKYTQKMALVPIRREGVENNQTIIPPPLITAPADNILSSLETEMREIMANQLMDDKTKWSLYEELLRRTQTLNKKQNPPREENEQWLNLFPLKYRAEAKRIFEHLIKNDARVRWSNSGGLVTIDGNQLLNSHISELIFYTLKINEGNKKNSSSTPWMARISAVR